MHWLRPSSSANRRLPPWLLGIVLALVVFMFLWPETGVDVLVTYGPAGRGAYIEGLLPRNPRFALWFFWLFARLPWKWDYLALMLSSVAVLVAATRWGGGDYWKVFLSFPFVWLLGYGQLDAYIAAGIALAWWALQRERYWIMGIGFCFACMLKPHVGIFASLCLWLWARNKWQPLVIPTVLVVLSLLQWGWDWPIRWLRATMGNVEYLAAEWTNISPLPWAGYWALLVWVPVLLVPMERFARLRSVLAATALSLPYFPAYQLLLLLVYPLSPVEWALSGLPFLGQGGCVATVSLPLLVIGVSIWPWLSAAVRRWASRRQYKNPT